MERKVEKRVGTEEAGIRLLDWLVRRFTYLSLEGWLEEIAASRITIDGRLASSTMQLAAGERVAFHPADKG
ncbi:MAG: hypothetical protein ACOYM2_21745, partial [Rectinemataceae bacterium]